MKPYRLSVKALIQNPDGRYLFIRRAPSSKANAGKWDLPGGKADPGETVDKALMREVLEETGLSVTIAGVAGAAESESPESKIAYLIFHAHTEISDVSLSGEHDAFQWLAPSELMLCDLATQFEAFIQAYVMKPRS
jgi:mutator protein MutT